ncbi:hypothetical protein BJ742DRAFT_853802 [Cladochytrium replicatum]|nr:hypothetical protein BJ742DRAFT_853802 [Cladochytrium replicatum]
MPSISAIFNNWRVPKFAALKRQQTDTADAEEKTTLVTPKPNADEQRYLRRLQKDLRRTQPQLVIHGHPAMGPRWAIENMPAISSTTIFNNMHVPKFAALKKKSREAVSVSDEKLIPTPPVTSERKYLRRIQKEQKRTQPQLVIHGHPAMGPRCAM